MAAAENVIPWAGTFDDLEAELRSDGRRWKQKDGRAICVSAYANIGDGRTRKTKGKRGRFRQEHLITSTSLLGLDFDEREEDWRAVARPLLHLDTLAYSTFSHGVPGKGSAPRYRLIWRLARSVTPAEYKALYLWAGRYLGGGVDTSCTDATRLLYTPRLKAPDANLDPWFERFRGAALDPDNLPDGSTVGQLLAAAEAADIGGGRKAMAEPEIAELRQRTKNLRPAALSRATALSYAACDRALDWCASASQRRPALFRAGCEIGRWMSARILSDKDAEAYAEAALETTTARMGGDDHDLRRQWDNGVAAGSTTPAVIDDDGALAGGHTAERKRSLPILDDDEEAPMVLDEARTLVGRIIRGAIVSRRPTVVAADPGVGKTEALLDAIPAWWLAGKTIRISVPTNKLAAEVLAKVRMKGLNALEGDDANMFIDSVGAAPKRTSENCRMFDGVLAGKRALGARGALDVCRLCNLHPQQNDGAVGQCSFFKSVVKAREYRITVTTHALEVERTPGTWPVVIDVAAFRAASSVATADSRYSVVAAYTVDDVFELSIVPSDAGSLAPTLEGDGCEQTATARAWCAAVGGVGEDDDSLRGRYEEHATGKVDLLVFDERPKAADGHLVVRAGDIRDWRAAGDLDVDDDTYDALILLLAAQPPASGGPEKAPSGAGPGELGAAAPTGTIRRATEWNTIGERLIREHAPSAGGGVVHPDLAGAPEDSALHAIASACDRGWAGCYVDKTGVLRITTARPLPTDTARAVLYLDGSATRESARAMFGGDTAFRRIRVQFHRETRVSRVCFSLSKGEAVRGELRRKVLGLRLRAVVKRWETSSTAWVLHKAWIVDPLVRHLLADALYANRVTYFGAADAVGSNRLEACTRIVLADWFVPQQAISAAGETLEIRAGDDPGLESVDWGQQAAHALVGSEILQAAYRVRPAQHPRELVFCTRRTLPAWWAPTDIDADILVADELGISPPGRAGSVWRAQRTVDRDGFYIPGVSTTVERVHEVAEEDSSLASSCTRETPVDGTGRPRCTPAPFPSWGALADAAGLELSYLRTSAGGHGLPVLYRSEAAPEIATLATALGNRGLHWIDWLGILHTFSKLPG